MTRKELLEFIELPEPPGNAAAFRDRIKTDAATYSIAILVNFCKEALCRNFAKEPGYGIKTMVADDAACADKNRTCPDEIISNGTHAKTGAELQLEALRNFKMADRKNNRSFLYA